MKIFGGRYQNSFMNLSISKKIILLMALFTVMLALSWSTLLVYLNNQLLKSENMAFLQESLGKAKKEMVRECHTTQAIANYYVMMPEIQRLVQMGNQYQPAYINSRILKAASQNPAFIGLAFYNKTGNVIDYISLDVAFDPINQTEISGRPFERLMDGECEYIWEYIDHTDQLYMKNERSDRLCLWHVICDIVSAQPIGVVAISLDSQELLFSEGKNKERNGLIMLDSRGKMAMGNDALAEMGDLQRKMLLQCAQRGADYTTISIGKRSYYAISSDIPDVPLTLYALSLIQNDPLNMVILPLNFIISSVLFFLLLFPIYYLLSRIITQPLMQLHRSIQQFSAGNFDANIHFKYNDEIGQLGRAFNNMVKENKRLIDQSYALKLRQKEAELNALQAQINPHFLYNLIGSIQWNAYRKGDEEIAEMAYSMGQVFRISLNRGNNMIFVEQEKDLILAYLKLQKKRYGDLLEYSIEIQEETLKIQMPKLIIQPLVENSIVHGMRGGGQNLFIKIMVSLDGERNKLLIHCCDNGIGILPQTLALLPDHLEQQGEGRSNRMAIKNIYERLQLTYHENFSFHIKSEANCGVDITIEIPVIPTQNMTGEG